jgi:hypothetical protein
MQGLCRFPLGRLLYSKESPVSRVAYACVAYACYAGRVTVGPARRTALSVLQARRLVYIHGSAGRSGC